ncbi:uncharacterized protein LTR77_009838 [Saxophila tyrrhenica]|uniref:Uncharacterized protein n=1 Tax=Saxophila tyrrhenica TaxID=1690608 RepID=A0AAV9P0R8_9PEZI|nr:hypothetical protein LTR77_009838 [Saxophila tyrrhenica]
MVTKGKVKDGLQVVVSGVAGLLAVAAAVVAAPEGVMEVEREVEVGSLAKASATTTKQAEAEEGAADVVVLDVHLNHGGNSDQPDDVPAASTCVASNIITRDDGEDGPYECRATQVYPLYHRLLLGEPAALDIEFQNYLHKKWAKCRHQIGRIAITNTKGGRVAIHQHQGRASPRRHAAYDREEDVRKFFPPV